MFHLQMPALYNILRKNHATRPTSRSHCLLAQLWTSWDLLRAKYLGRCSRNSKQQTVSRTFSSHSVSLLPGRSCLSFPRDWVLSIGELNQFLPLGSQKILKDSQSWRLSFCFCFPFHVSAYQLIFPPKSRRNPPASSCPGMREFSFVERFQRPGLFCLRL